MNQRSLTIPPKDLSQRDLDAELRHSCRTALRYLHKIELADVFPHKMTGTEWSIMQSMMKWWTAVLAEADRRWAIDIATTAQQCPGCNKVIPLNELIVLNKDGPSGPVRCPRCKTIMPPSELDTATTGG